MTVATTMQAEILPRDWPNRAASRFVRAAGMTWHVQTMGAGPLLLMAHGTGAATHSWRALAPLLAAHFSVVAPDLPGHGFSPAPPKARLTLPFMARALSDLCHAMAVRPAIVVGHSAGAAILARACLDGMMDPRALVSLNGALLPLFGLPGKIFSPLAKLVIGIPGLANMFLRHTGNRAVVERLLRETGSTIDAQGVDLYARLAADPVHAGAALNMMASWDLPPLARDLPRLKPKMLLIVGDNDRSIAPADSDKVRGMVPGATLARLPRLGHLAHEEAPDATAALVTEFAQTAGVLPA